MENTARVLSENEDFEAEDPKNLIDFRKAYRKKRYFKSKKARKLYLKKRKRSDAARKRKIQQQLEKIGIHIPPKRDLLQKILWEENQRNI